MTQEDIAITLSENLYYDKESDNILGFNIAAKEIYKLHLEDKLKLIIGFRSYLISEGFELLADEYFEEEEKLQQELKSLGE